MTIKILMAVVSLAWMTSTALAVAALVLAILSPSIRFRLVVIFASVAVGLAYLGFGRWTPFKFFPQIGYTWSSGNFQISLQSSWFFVAPMVLGLAALVVLFGNRRRAGDARG